MRNYPNLNVDLSTCDREPIHIIGRVQPHGFMLLLDNKTLVVEQLSENISSFLDVDATSLTNNTLALLTTPEEYTVLKHQLRNTGGISPQLLKMQGKRFFGFIHLTDGRLVVECEPFQSSEPDQELLELSWLYARFQSELNVLDSLLDQADLLVKFVQQILDYDRVMLYRFDEEWNGEVVAEETKPDIYSYLYHHFPASDIPSQARAMLEKKPIRQIPNVSAQAVNITPYLNPRTGAPANIILSELRNPSEIHLEYLKNMGVLGTLSFSIIVKGKLWGIIACQHQSPVFINFWKRQVCYWVAQAFANAILAGQEKRDLHLMESYKHQEEELMQRVINSGSIEKGLFGQNYSLLNLTSATGAAIYINKQLLTIGITPGDKELRQLLNWLSVNNSERLFYTRQLSSVYPEAAVYSQEASGLLALEISRYNQEYILYFKPEIQETRIWAGNPDKPAATEQMHLTPRESFEKWAQVVEGRSLPWSLNELDITQTLLKDVLAFILRSQAASLKALNAKVSASADAIKAKNQRLEDFAHIITHNLRSPMLNIRGLYQLYTAQPDPELAAEVIEKINGVVDNMGTTIDDLNLIVQSEFSQELEQQEVVLQEVIAKELENLQSMIMETGAKVETDLQETVLFAPKVYVESIIHNLLSNALKYHSPERKPIVRIKSWRDKEKVFLEVADNGLGMDMEKVKKKIFNLYTTFHRNKNAKGLGLYLTKVQTEALGGTISVSSKPNEGSTFTVCLKLPGSN